MPRAEMSGRTRGVPRQAGRFEGAQHQRTVRPIFIEVIEPSKQYTDISVPLGGENRVVIEILKARINQLLASARVDPCTLLS
jgi:uridine kinase